MIDQKLFRIAQKYNTPAFASYGPDNHFRFRVVSSRYPKPSCVDSAVKVVSENGKCPLNICGFTEKEVKTCANNLNQEQALAKARDYMCDGLNVLISECLPENFTMVSGLARHGRVMLSLGAQYFDNCSNIPVAWGNKILSAMLGIDTKIPATKGKQICFSAYSRPVGVRSQNIVVLEEKDGGKKEQTFINPNDPFANLFGEDAWGLILAWAAGFNVPKTSLFLPNIFYPFISFGTDTGQKEAWTKTCPSKDAAARQSTIQGFQDPFLLMQGQKLSCMIQQDIRPQWAGKVRVYGRETAIPRLKSFSDPNMPQGEDERKIPNYLRHNIHQWCCKIREIFNSNFEISWVYDGEDFWLLRADLAYNP